MSTTEVDGQPVASAGDGSGPDAPAGSGPAMPHPSHLVDSTDGRWLGVPFPTWRRVLRVLAPGLLFLAVREIGLLVLGWMADRNDIGMTRALTSWDGQWYLGIASGGYHGVPAALADAFGRRTADTPLAFFPGYPMLVRWVAYLPGVDLVAAGLTVTMVSGVACAYGLSRLGERITGSAGVGLVLVTLFAASPMAIVESMTYSETMFCALAAWSLVGLVRRNWLLAGLCAAAAGLVRPTAAALVLTVAVAAIVAIIRRRDGLWPWLGGLLAPLGLVGYLGFVASKTGSLSGWFAVEQQGWNSRFDGGVATVRFGLDVLATGRSVLEVVSVALLVVAAVMVVLSIRQRLPWPVVLYGVLVLAMDFGSNGLMNSKARLLLPAFTLLLPAAIGLLRRRPGTVVTVLAGLAVASAWFGAYAITSWPYAI